MSGNGTGAKGLLQVTALCSEARYFTLTEPLLRGSVHVEKDAGKFNAGGGVG